MLSPSPPGNEKAFKTEGESYFKKCIWSEKGTIPTAGKVINTCISHSLRSGCACHKGRQCLEILELVYRHLRHLWELTWNILSFCLLLLCGTDKQVAENVIIYPQETGGGGAQLIGLQSKWTKNALRMKSPCQSSQIWGHKQEGRNIM